MFVFFSFVIGDVIMFFFLIGGAFVFLSFVISVVVVFCYWWMTTGWCLILTSHKWLPPATFAATTLAELTLCLTLEV